jgi:murein DD-endopeptidase MepM/ murein hydrolase activator NlpD
VQALPVRRPSSHRPESQPPESALRALLPAVLLWLAAMVALVAPASLAPALAGSSTLPAADPVPQAATSASPAADPAGTTLAADPAGTRPARGFASATPAGLASGGIRPARAATAPWVPALRPPVDGPLVRGFEEAAGPFGPGHRGVDFGAVPGVPVRAPASGRVTFAGQVAGTTWVTIQVAPAVLVTLGPLRTLEASVGQAATTGDRLGTLASGHASPDPSVAALHLGLRVHRTYIDPLPWLAGLARPRLAPLSEPGGPH